MKYERFDPITKVYKIVKQRDGGGARFLDVSCSDIVTFKVIRERAEKLFFYDNNCNHFLENISECYVTINDLSGHTMDETESLWDYVERKGIIISKTVLILRSCDESLWHLNCDEDDDEILPSAFPTVNTPSLTAEVTDSIKRKICGTCSSTYIGDDCLRCTQDNEYDYSLQQDSLRLFDGELTGTEDVAHQPIEYLTMQEDSSCSSSGIVIPEELRERRLQHFGVTQEHSLKINRLKMKEYLIRHFTNEKVFTLYL